MDSWFGEGAGHWALCEARKRLEARRLRGAGSVDLGGRVCVSSAAARLFWVKRAGGSSWPQGIGV